ncbi:MAG: riboflavin kinase, partial [Bacteroides sp.]
AIQQGDTAYAARLMGRNFSFRGTVAHGFQLGQRMGFPTANIEPYEPWQLVPGHGVYEGWCRIRTGSGGERFKAVVNVGTRPTVSSGRAVSIEAHLLDFQGDLYGQELEVGFNRKLRPELKFSSVDDLKVQIAKDIECVRTGR